MPLYAVTNTQTDRVTLVEAPRPETALRLVTEGYFTVETPSAMEAARLAQGGARLMAEDGTIIPNATPATGTSRAEDRNAEPADPEKTLFERMSEAAQRQGAE